jgi:hypothetical protein
VVAYPKLTKHDAAWIDSFRAEYDKKHHPLIDPHFTLIFPTDKNISPESLRKHVEDNATSSFEAVCRCAQVVDNPFIKKWHIFLVPDEGYSLIVKLRDRLYTGELEDELRLDIQFIPHIGIATLDTARECNALADGLNSNYLGSYRLAVRTWIDHLDICSEVEDKIVSTARVNLLKE